MQIRVKSFQKVIQSSARLDRVFESQGFKKTGGNGDPYYRLKIADISTRANYEIQIPIYEVQSKHGPLYKINEMTVRLKNPTTKHYHVPEAIVNAAQEKIKETLSYLSESNASEMFAK